MKEHVRKNCVLVRIGLNCILCNDEENNSICISKSLRCILILFSQTKPMSRKCSYTVGF